MADKIVEINNISCLSGSRFLINHITWDIQKGDRWVVFGRNGCGKTTLLSVIAGYRKFTGGDLKVFGEQYTSENILQQRKRIGWISSSFFDTYYHSESVKDIVLSGLTGTLGRIADVCDADEQRGRELGEELGIGEKWNMPFNMLSKGERQHVLIARAFITSPELLILDEPGTGLDVLARERLLEIVRKLALQQQITVIYVTHYVEEILPVFDKCLLLKNGLIFRIGKTKELITSESLSSFFNYPIFIENKNGRYGLSSELQEENIDMLIRKAGYCV